MEDIVVGMDASPGSKLALEWALAEARLRHATLRVVHAVTPPEAHSPYGVVPADQREMGDREHERGAWLLLESAISDAKNAAEGIAVEPVVRIGAAAEVLVAESRDAAMLVVGSRGRGGLTRLLLGSVSQACVQHATAPVVVVPAR